MKLVVGLGNPGEKYKDTRHNAGFMVLDALADKFNDLGYMSDGDWKESKKGQLNYRWFSKNDEKIEIIKPQAFVNSSGLSVFSAYKKHSVALTHIFVVHDDLDIKLGQYKIQLGRGPKVHNGLLSIYEKLGTKDFWHVRIGIDNRKAKSEERRVSGEEYVLEKFTQEERKILDKVIEQTVGELVTELRN